MDDGQRNRLRMFRAVGAFLKKEEGRWNAIPANGAAHTDLLAGISAIEDTVRRQEKALEGVSENKGKLRKLLENAVLVVANPAASFAAAVGDVLLAAEAGVGPNRLEKMQEHELDGVAVRLAKAVGSHMAALADYGISAADVAAMEAARVEFGKVASSPVVAKAERTGETRMLKTQMTAVGALLTKRMDKLMARYQVLDPGLYAGYRAARVVIDLRGPGKADEDGDG